MKAKRHSSSKRFIIFSGLLLFVVLSLLLLNRPSNAPDQSSSLDNVAIKIYVANEGDGTISVIDAQSLSVIDTISLDGFPHNVNADPLGRYIFATNHEGEADEGEENEGDHMDGKTQPYLRMLDAKTHKLLNSIPMDQMAAHVVPSRDGKLVYVSLEGSNELVAVDLATQTIVKRFTVGKGPHGFVLSADGSTAYVPNMRTHDVSVVDLAQGKETRLPISFEGNACETPVAMGITIDDCYAFVTCGTSFDVYKIDIQQQKVVAHLAFKKGAFPGPIQIPVHPQNQYLYIPDMRNSVVHKVDIDSFTLVNDISVGKGAHGIAFSKDGARAYVTNTWENAVAVIDLKTENVIKTIPVGVKPNGIAVSNGKNQGW